MSRRVHDIFSRIADRYDLTNTILSLGLHRWWRRRVVARMHPAADARVLDCATGTGDLAIRFARQMGPEGEVVGCDFNEAMLERARRKVDTPIDGAPLSFVYDDVMDLDVESNTFDLATIAFGIRNVDEPVEGLREMARVVRPGGEVAILEFGRPEGLFGKLYEVYESKLLPRIGGWLTGAPDAYRYLHESASSFPFGDDFVEMARSVEAFETIEAEPLTGGAVYLYRGTVGP